MDTEFPDQPMTNTITETWIIEGIEVIVPKLKPHKKEYSPAVLIAKGMIHAANKGIHPVKTIELRDDFKKQRAIILVNNTSKLEFIRSDAMYC